MSSHTSPPNVSVAILMYHRVGGEVPFLNVTAPAFHRQMRLLQRMGYEGVRFDHAAGGLLGFRTLPRKPVCVTFDDGYTCIGEHAAPVLAELRWPATVFVPTAYVGGRNEWDSPAGLPMSPIMDWPALKELAARGWEMAGHTRSHPKLADMDDDDALADIAAGRQDLADNLGPLPSTFCYPYGSLNDRTPRLAMRAGFQAGCTTKSGLAYSNSNPFLLPRVKIAHRDNIAGFLYRLLIRPHLP